MTTPTIPATGPAASRPTLDQLDAADPLCPLTADLLADAASTFTMASHLLGWLRTRGGYGDGWLTQRPDLRDRDARAVAAEVRQRARVIEGLAQQLLRRADQIEEAAAEFMDATKAASA